MSDDQNLVANAGLLAAATLSQRVELQELTERIYRSRGGLEMQTWGKNFKFRSAQWQ